MKHYTKLYGLFCDTPLTNLLTDLLIGVYGYPYYANMQKHERIEYRAKKTTMFSDRFVLDQCRYMYDLVPALASLDEDLPLCLQMVLRICMDAVRRHGH